MTKNSEKKYFTPVGFISKPHGFNGELIVAVEYGQAEDYADASFLFIELEGRPVPFFVEESEARDSTMIVKVEGVNTEAEARKLSGKKIFIESGDDPEVHVVDWSTLIGYIAFDETKGQLGPIESIEEFPGQLIAKCSMHGKEILIPLAEDFITGIDEKKKEIHLDLPEGLLDVYLE